MKKLFALIAVLAVCGMSSFAENTQIANPIVEIQDDDVFEETLGIEFDEDEFIAAKPEMSVIAGTMGQVRFTLENVDGVPVDWTLRFTRDDACAGSPEALLGIYDENMSEPAVTEVSFQDDADEPEVNIALTEIDALTEGFSMYFWDYAGAHYGLSIQGIASQMQIAAVMDSVFEATID